MVTRSRPSPRPLALVVLMLLALVAACSGEGALPAGPELMKKTAEAMKTVKSATFAITTEGTPAVPLRKADGRLTTAGDADGTLSVELFGQLTEMSFVLLGDTVYFKGPTGGFQTMTRQTLMHTLSYDPAQILDPAKGLAQILTTAANPTVDGEEGGAYRATAALKQDALKALVPGVNQDVNAQFLIDKATSRINRVTLPLQGGSATVTLSDYDAAVQITPPPAG
ncbi:LppX_LprAFG lipoprotein [Nonomuraea sp. NPDC050310]|uniref:LppX_LprAFG lipoprotein n=1 Tax=Nonomuraea sp. NPDC050310 TaxID=3154935 RepID=UPI0033C8C208